MIDSNSLRGLPTQKKKLFVVVAVFAAAAVLFFVCLFVFFSSVHPKSTGMMYLDAESIYTYFYLNVQIN